MQVLNSLMAAALLLASAGAQAGYRVSIDAGSLAGQSGYVDFSLIGLNDSPASRADIRKLFGIGFNGPAEWADGTTFNADGSVALGSSNGSIADWLQPVWFGQTLQFELDFGGDWQTAGSGSGSTFALKLLDGNYNPLLHTDSDGNLLTAELSPGAPPVFSQWGSAQVQAVPEPASWAMFGAGLLVLLAQLRRRPQ